MSSNMLELDSLSARVFDVLNEGMALTHTGHSIVLTAWGQPWNETMCREYLARQGVVCRSVEPALPWLDQAMFDYLYVSDSVAVTAAMLRDLSALNVVVTRQGEHVVLCAVGECSLANARVWQDLFHQHPTLADITLHTQGWLGEPDMALWNRLPAVDPANTVQDLINSMDSLLAEQLAQTTARQVAAQVNSVLLTLGPSLAWTLRFCEGHLDRLQYERYYLHVTSAVEEEE